MSLVQNLNKILSFGFLKPGDTYSRFTLVQLSLLISLTLSLIRGIENLTNNDYLTASIFLFIFIAFIANIIIHYKYRNKIENYFLVVVSLVSILIFTELIINFGFYSNYISILGLLPVFLIHSLGLRKGSILSAAGFLVLAILLNPYIFLMPDMSVDTPSFYELFIIFLAVYFFYAAIEIKKDHIAEILFNEKIKAENSLQSKKEFTSSLSHKIRTPLNDLVVLNALLSEKVLNTEQKNIVETLTASTNNLVNIVQTLSEISDSGISSHKPEKTVFNLRSAINSTIEFYSNKNIKGLSLSLNDKEVWKDLVVGDPVIFKQILLTIYEIFIRSRKNEEDINIDLEISSLELGNGNYKYFFKISAGLLIFDKNDKLQKPLAGDNNIFNAKTLDEELHYISLSQSKQLVESIGGELKADMNKSSTWFIFSIPLQLAESDHYPHKIFREPAEDELKNDKKPEESSLLLVEDNELNQKILCLGLKDYFKNIDIAGNGKEALDKFGNSKYDIILMDIQMEVMDGLSATIKIREIEKSSNTHVPIIAVTANALIGDKEKCISAGMDDYISKPFKIEDLMVKIKKLL